MPVLPPVVLEVTAKATQAIATLDAVSEKIHQTSLSAASVGKASGAIALGTGAVAAGLAVVVAESAKAAGNFQQSMKKLTTSAGEPVDNLKMVSDGILQLARDTGATSEQLADGMYKVASAGFHGADGLNVLKAAEEGAKAEGADLETVSDAVSSALIDYHLKAGDAADVTSKLVAATAQGKMRFQDLAGAMPAILPVASAAHVSLNDILGDLASMTVHGMSAQQASENMADAIRHMQNPTAQQAKEFALLGMTVQQVQDDLQNKGLSGTLQDIQEHIAKMMPPGTENVILSMKTAMAALSPAAQDLAMKMVNGEISMKEYTKAALELDPVSAKQAQQFSTLLGQTHQLGNEQLTGEKVLQTYGQAFAKATGDATGLKVGLMLTGENAKTTNDAIKAVSGAAAEAGGHVKGWSEIQSNFNTQFDRAKEVIETLKIQIGTAFLPILGNLLNKFQAIAKPVIDWVGHNKELVAGIIAGTAATFGLVAVVGALTVALTFLSANPIVLVITGIVLAIGALVGAVILAYNKIGWFHDMVDLVFRGIRTVIDGVFSWLNQNVVPVAKKAWDEIGKGLSWLNENVFQPVWKDAKEVTAKFATYVKTELVPIVTKAWDDLKPGLKKFWDDAKPILEELGKYLKSIVIILHDTVVPGVEKGFDQMAVATEGAKAAFKLMKDDADAAFDALKFSVSTLHDKIVVPIQNLGDELYSAGASIVSALGKGIADSVSSALTGPVLSVVGFIADHMPHSPAKRGPLSGQGYTLYSGQALVRDFAKGMTDTAYLVESASAYVTAGVSITGAGGVSGSGFIPGTSQREMATAGAGRTVNITNYVTAQTNATGPQIADSIGWALRNQN
ncbi:phage tail tape measure protein [Sinomonas albida]|uniref:phage tail tape measure protein n=1 Tax=Sinomonas albida TaxID=369942 RepID=UPI0030167095